MTTLDNDFLGKTNEIFYCKYCDYTTCIKYNFKIHNKSIKHKNNALTTKNNAFLGKIRKKYECDNCKKNFNDRAGLWRHKKKCKIIVENSSISDSDSDDEGNKNQNNIIDKDLIMMLIKDHSETKAMMLKIIENGTTNNSHNNTNSHNKAFNLQFFLNETCKNAMNITDFVESITPQLEDLEDVCESGYIKGISNIIVKNLKALDVTERPVHCVDKKREVLYVKDEDKWEKEDEDKKKLRKAIKKVASKNYKLLPKYREKYPGCQFSESKHADHYNKLVIEVMGGEGNNDEEKENKIIRNISKVIIVDKSMQEEDA